MAAREVLATFAPDDFPMSQEGVGFRSTMAWEGRIPLAPTRRERGSGAGGLGNY